VFIWFVGSVSLAVWLVFRDDRFDYRVLALGALAPDIVDGLAGGTGVAHSITASVAVLAAVMALTAGKRPLRRRWLALPIGMFMHLVVDGVFSDTAVFWWPFTGLALDGGPLPSVERGRWNIALELLGAAMIAFLWRTHRLGDPSQRSLLVREGRLVESNPPEVGTC
jgi:hypothetical protein